MKSIQSEPHLLMFVIMSCYFVLWASHPTSDCYLTLISVSVHPIYIYISIIYIYIYISISTSVYLVVLSTNLRKAFTSMEKAPTRRFQPVWWAFSVIVKILIKVCFKL